MGRTWLALLEATLSSSHGRAGSPHLRRVHLESMDVAAAGMGVRGARARLGIRAARPGPWPHPLAGVTTLPLSSVQFWRAGPSGGARPPMLQAPLLSSWSTLMSKGTTPTMGYWEPVARIAQRGQEQRARHPSGEQHATPARRARTTQRTQAQGPPVHQRCFVCRSLSARGGTSRKRKPSADAAALTAPRAGLGHLVPAPERLSKVRKADR